MIIYYLKFCFAPKGSRRKKKKHHKNKGNNFEWNKPPKQTNEAAPEKVPVVFCVSRTSPALRAYVMGKWKKTIPQASYSQCNSNSSFCLRALMSILLVWIKGVLSHLAISRRAIVHKSIHGMALLFQSISIILLAASATLRSHLFSHLFKLCS